MKKATLLASSLLLAGYIVFSSYQAGAALNGFVCTGGETDNGNAAGCTTGRGCHANTSTAGINVSITLDSAGGKATTHYVGGGSYTIVLKGTNTTNSTLPHFGFQLQAIKGSVATATPSDAGTFGTAPTNTHLVAPGSNCLATVFEQSTKLSPATGSGATGTTYTISIPWTAPAKGTGTISFWAALNAVDNTSGADTGDLWNTTSSTIQEWPAVNTGISNEPAASMDVKAYPNPFSSALALQFGNDLQPGKYMVTAYDMSGRRVSIQEVEVGSAGTVQALNTAAWAAGMHTLVIENATQRQHIAVIKQ